MSGDDSEEEWRFSLDEFDDPPEESPATDAPAGDGDEPAEESEEASVAGEFSPEVPVVPEMPRLEHAVFVTLGAVVTVLAFASVAGGQSFDVVDAALVVAVVGGLGAVIYGALVRLTPDT